MENILVIDDDEKILELVQEVLKNEHYIVETRSYVDNTNIGEFEGFDLILLDIMLPFLDGYEILERIKNIITCPVIFLSAKSSEGAKVKGLMSGADDYITKPFSIRELVARVKVALRRNLKNGSNGILINALKESLYQTWKIENEKNEEIAALAHDIKIPLTIISGNTELLKCYSSDEYSLSHLQSIWGAVGKMEEYINLLIKYVKADRIDFHEKESMPCNSFSHKIVSEIKEYISGSEEIIKFNVEKVRGTIKIDYISLERAIFNIIDNAIEYKVYGDKIMCFIGKKDDSYIFTICNEKGEFSSQVLENGTKLFFTSNNNRNSIHYGIGLAYANKVIQSCEGELELYNSKEHGAVVSIKLPIT